MAQQDAIYIQGQEKLKRWIDRVLRQTGNHSTLFEDIGDILLDGVHDRFERGIAPNGRPWQKSWRAIAQGGKTLRDTGRLLNSFFAVPRKTGVTVKTNVEYAPYLHYGAVIKPISKPHLAFRTPMGGWMKAKRVVLPARPIFGVSEDDAQNILFAVEDYLEEILRNAK